MSLFSTLQLIPITACHLLSRQTLGRQAEPSAVTDDAQHVLEYDQVMTTKLAIAYVLGLEVIATHRPTTMGGCAIDLACGPGHFAILMAKTLRLDSLLGIDLSPGMVATATANGELAKRPGLKFEQGNITSLNHIANDSFDLATCMNAAHHMPTLADVTLVLAEMDRITRPEGIVVVMDLARFRSRWLTDWYVKAMAHDYPSRGLEHFMADFRNSMYAAWTPQELRSALPRKSKRNWRQLVARGLPTGQLLIGVPQGTSASQSTAEPLDVQELIHLLPINLHRELGFARLLSFKTSDVNSPVICEQAV